MINLTPDQLFSQFSLILMSLGLIVACHCISTSDYQTSNILKVATEPAFPPFQFQENTGELKGFDIDLIKASEFIRNGLKLSLRLYLIIKFKLRIDKINFICYQLSYKTNDN